VAVGGGGSGPDLCVFLFFYSFQKHYSQSLNVLTTHHYHEPEIRLPVELGRERYAATHDNYFPMSEPGFAVRNQLTTKRPFLVVTFVFLKQGYFQYFLHNHHFVFDNSSN
jgi:hypothetical protein